MVPTELLAVAIGYVVLVPETSIISPKIEAPDPTGA